MRIISGKWKGRRIHPPAKMPFTRPTTDVAKEGLFNILQNRINLEGVKTLDLFSGTGSISYELASRGASFLTMVEKDRQMSSFIQNNLKELGITDMSRVYQMDVFMFLQSTHESFDFIFAGPPYMLKEIDNIPLLIYERNVLATGGIFVLEHTPRNNYEAFEGFMFQRNYGTTIFSFFGNENNIEL